MSRPTLAGQTAVEWWRASGARTLERLYALCDHFATVNALSDRAEVYAIARALVADWEVAS
jgi:hypothetical protein